MSNKQLTTGLIAVAIIAIGAYFFPAVANSGLFGTTPCASITCLSGGLRLVSDAGGDFESDVATVLNGKLTVTTSNTATSTASLGCIQTTATSTATPIKLVFQATTTQGISGQLAANVGNFVVLGQYGNCP